jgi:hypothetical protein
VRKPEEVCKILKVSIVLVTEVGKTGEAGVFPAWE